MTLVRGVSWLSAGRSVVSCYQPSLRPMYLPLMLSCLQERPRSPGLLPPR
jgi:hypothetical protein